jgi:hypothetical protein
MESQDGQFHQAGACRDRRHRHLRDVLAVGGCLAFYALNTFWLARASGWAFARCYANDVAAGVLICAWLSLTSAWLGRPRPAAGAYVALVACAAFAWESVWPALFPARSVSDPGDVLAYFAGMALWLAPQLRRSVGESLQVPTIANK